MLNVKVSKLEYLKFLSALLKKAHADQKQEHMDYLMKRIDSVIAEAFEAGATQEQVDNALN